MLPPASAAVEAVGNINNQRRVPIVPTTTKVPATLDVIIDCPAPGCEGGKITHQHARIANSAMKHHLANHAYSNVSGGGSGSYNSKPIGADCDCPRIMGPKTTASCQACKGTGTRHVTLVVPKPGQKVNVSDRELLENIFGDDVPDYPGVVYDVQTPDEHRLELRTGLGVRASWDLLKDGKTIRSGDVQVWTFDLLELVMVK